ncbi:MAG: AraC family transcriptional regulator [Muribaculaceae bacterium]|nr:AraC family transcriptional regulator [Muribaculaceae bacterium]
MKEIIIDSLNTYNALYGLRTTHPLIGVLDIGLATNLVNDIKMRFDVYALFLKNGAQCSLRYGRRNYDYQEGTVVSFAPGQVVEITDETETGPKVTGLLFHPDLIYGTPLATKIDRFGFFDYTQAESLHLSDRERDKFNFFVNLISEELEHPIDSHSAAVLSAHIQLLLEHLDRFYDRQFITRHKVNSDVVARFRTNLTEYFTDNVITAQPSVAYFADKAALSPGYFSDLIKKETGMSPKDIITLQLIAEAKKRLAETDDDISQIAYSLGFEYPAHFTRAFKRVTGVTPTEFRVNIN